MALAEIEAARALAAAHKQRPGGLLPALHDIQDAPGAAARGQLHRPHRSQHRG